MLKDVIIDTRLQANGPSYHQVAILLRGAPVDIVNRFAHEIEQRWGKATREAFEALTKGE